MVERRRTVPPSMQVRQSRSFAGDVVLGHPTSQPLLVFRPRHTRISFSLPWIGHQSICVIIAVCWVLYEQGTPVGLSRSLTTVDWKSISTSRYIGLQGSRLRVVLDWDITKYPDLEYMQGSGNPIHVGIVFSSSLTLVLVCAPRRCSSQGRVSQLLPQKVQCPSPSHSPSERPERQSLPVPAIRDNRPACHLSFI